MAELVRRQDLPPPGGYQRIDWTRQPPKKYFSGLAMFAGVAVMTAIGSYIYTITRDKIKREKIEMRSGLMATMPLLIAERDREHLKTLYRNREMEAKLMKNVEGWKVGTWYGEPIYKTIEENEYILPLFEEYYAHISDEKRMEHGLLRHHF